LETDQQTVTMEPLPFRWKAFWASFFLLLWSIGLSLQNPGLMADDSGEMVAAASCLGLPHPPGYPLFTLFGHIACALPLGSPAFRINLLSMMFLVLAVVVTLQTGRRLMTGWVIFGGPHFLRQREFTLLGGGLILFFSLPVLGQALTAKGAVYTMTLCVLALLIDRFVAEGGEPSPKAMCYLLGLWSLGLANHWQTQILWVPVLLLVGVLAWRRVSLRWWLIILSLCGVGVSVYIVLPIRSVAHPYLQWGDASRFGDFWWIISRKLVSSTEGQIRSWGTYQHFVSGYSSTMFVGAFPGTFFLSVIGVMVSLKRRMKMVLFALCLYLPMTAAVLFYAREEVFYLVSVYLVAGQGLVVLGAMVGLVFVLDKTWARTTLRNLVLSAWVLGAICWIPYACRMEDKSRYFLAQDLGTNVMQALPREAFFLAEGDISVFPIWYLQSVLGLRKDVAMVPAQFFLHPWGWEQAVRLRPQLEGKTPATADPRIQWNILRSIFGNTEVNGTRGLFLAMDRWTLQRNDPGWVKDAVPMGLVHLVTKRPIRTSEMLLRDRELRSHQRTRSVESPAGSRGDDFVSRQIHRYYRNVSFQGALWLESKGDLWGSLDLFDRGFQSPPEELSALAGAARVIGKLGYPEVSIDLCEIGLRLDPDVLILQNNRSYAAELASQESSAEKKMKYRALFNGAHSKGWVFLNRCLGETVERLASSEGR
jgi:hypothetical protein